jgi:hypothetical protein
MNTLMLVALAVVALCYCGGKYCPKVLSGKKEMLLGVLVGMALCSFAGLKLEGFMVTPECCRMGNFNGNVIEWDNGSPGTCDPGDTESAEYTSSTGGACGADATTCDANPGGGLGWVERCNALLSAPPPPTAPPTRTAKRMREENRGLPTGGIDLNGIDLKVNKP